MKREELLRNSEYWKVQIQNGLFGIIEEYKKKNNLNRTKLAEKFGVSKGYITQVLNGDFDHKISKFVELALASGKAPKITFVDLEQFIKEDAEKKTLSPDNTSRKIENSIFIDSSSDLIDIHSLNEIRKIIEKSKSGNIKSELSEISYNESVSSLS